MSQAALDAVSRESGALLAFLVAIAITLVATPLVARFARRLGAVDQPDARRVHTVPTPLWGGMAVAAGALVATVLFMDWDARPGVQTLFREQMIVTLIAAVFVALLGAIDDLRDLRWKTKLVGQIGAALLVVLLPLVGAGHSGVSQLTLVVRRLDPPLLEPLHLPELLGVVLPVVWIVAVMNMVNFIDGVDGLAAGTCAISAATFALVAASFGRSSVAVLAAATCGAALAFLRYNFRTDGAHIFMGDSGSMLLGFLLAVIAVQGVLKTAAAVSLVIPLALMLVPILDTMFVVAKRVKYSRSLASPDKWHLHHRLLNVGYTPRRVAVAFWGWTASMGLLALALRFVNYGKAGDWHAPGLAVLAFFGALALALTAHILVALEIVKLRHVRERNARIAAARELGDTPSPGSGRV